MTGHEILAQAAKGIQEDAQALATVLDLAGVPCILEFDGPVDEFHSTKVCPLITTNVHVEIHICGTIIVWIFDCGVPVPDIITAAITVKELVGGGR